MSATELQSAIDLLTNDIPANPPEEFTWIPTGAGFNQLIGPVYGRMQDGKLRIGMRITNRHINPHQTCHGSLLAAFADMQVYASQLEADLRYTLIPTINMTIDYISAAVLGDWLEGHTSLLRATKSTIFQQTVAMVGTRPVFRASGIYKISKTPAPTGSSIGAVFDDPGKLT
jgi:uncharacterized protein (TIGR00369 family)